VAARLVEAHADRRIAFEIQPGLLAAADPRLLEIVLTNLFENAVKFTRTRDSAVVVFGRTEIDGGAAFFVRDNGVGFDMAYADALFGPFKRLHRASEFPGTGIGLATVQRIVTRHHGRVWAVGAAGAGATFYLTLGIAT
jgi:light-regulated signal transduction histidine kinase (bacteriophytochrome)